MGVESKTQAGLQIADHPLAAIFPLMGDADLDALAADIKAAGQQEPVWLFEDCILDGRNRYRACDRAGVSPRFQTYHGDDPLGFVISKNLHRRHLTESQRAMVAANIAGWKKGDNQHTAGGSANLPTLTQAQAAQQVSVSERSVRDAVKVKESGVPELVKAVESGEATVSAAAEVAKLPKAEQKKAVKAGKVKEKAAEKRKEKKAKKDEPAPTEDELRNDELGQLLTEALAAPADPENPPLDPRFMPGATRAVGLAEKFRTWKAQLVALRTAVRKEFPDRDEVMARRIDARGQFDAALTELADTLDRNIPEHVCPDCCGTGRAEKDDGPTCKFCDGFGVVDRHHHGGLKARWKRTAPRLAALVAAAEGR